MMKVTSPAKHAVRFDSLPEGTPFVDCDGDHAVKNSQQEEAFNAVVFYEHAFPFAYEPDDLVTPTPFTVQFTLEDDE